MLISLIYPTFLSRTDIWTVLGKILREAQVKPPSQKYHKSEIVVTGLQWKYQNRTISLLVAYLYHGVWYVLYVVYVGE